MPVAKEKKGKKDKDVKTDEPENDAMAALSNTPRSKLAMTRCGILLEEVQVKRFHEFYIPGDGSDKQRKRFTHYEMKRQGKVGLILRERAKILVENQRKKTMPDAATRRSYLSLQAMEQVLDKEAGRLEHELQQQLKYHQALEADNEAQLDKEKKLRDTLETRDERRKAAIDAHWQKINKNKQAVAARKKVVNKKLKDIVKKKEGKLASCLANILETEVRLQKFNNEKAGRAKEASDSHHEKLAEMDAKIKKMEDDRLESGDAAIARKKKQIEDLCQRKAEDQNKKALQMLELDLKARDVLERKQRLERTHDYRLSLIKDENMKTAVRVEKMIGMKDQMIHQRKKRLHCPNKFQSVSLKNLALGPGQYTVDRDAWLNEVPVTKISTAGVEKGHVEFADQAAARTRDIPPPGTYDPKTLPDGNKVESCSGIAVRFPKGDLPNFAQVQASLTIRNPGPGRYDPNVEVFHPTIGAKMLREKFPKEKKEPPAFCQVVRYGPPGPGTYSVDEFMRKEDLRTAQKGQPSLISALNVNPTTAFLK